MSFKPTRYGKPVDSRSGGDRPRKDFGGDRREGGSAERREFKPRPDFNNDRREGGAGERREFKPRPDFNNDRSSERKEFTPRKDFGGDRREGGAGERREFKPRPDFNNDRREGGAGERREYKPRPDFNNDRREGGSGERKEFTPRKDFGGDRREGGAGERREFKPKSDFNNDRREGGSGERREFKPRPDFNNDRREGGSTERREFKPKSDNPNDGRAGGFGGRKDYSQRPDGASGEKKNEFPKKDGIEEVNNERSEFKPRENWSEQKEFSPRREPTGERREFAPRKDAERPERERRPRRESTKDEPSRYHGSTPNERPEAPNYNWDRAKAGLPDKHRKKIEKEQDANDGTIRLNRYISNAGICSRRDADKLIDAGEIKVNGVVITEMGFKVNPTSDIIKYKSKVLDREKMVYVLLNKPKDYLTTTDDPQERRTVMDLLKDVGDFRLYPVGRLDRNTTGLLLLTNDGELASKLSHPSNEISKIYQAELDKPLTEAHFEAIKAGIELEDGNIKPDDLGIVTPDNMVIGIKIHSGRNRIVRRIFESLGYDVLKLDRTTYAGLDKKDLPRGRWRFLQEKELIRLKYFV